MLLLYQTILRSSVTVLPCCHSALPLNGGSYTLLLNTSPKAVAAISASLTLLRFELVFAPSEA